MITTYTGPMHSGKSARLFNAYDSVYNKIHLEAFQPTSNTRDEGITSKDFDRTIPTIKIDYFEDIEKYITPETTVIIIDEVQFLKGNPLFLEYLSMEKDIDIYLAGLSITSELIPFDVMPEILAISNYVENIPGSCYDCGRQALYTYYIYEKTVTKEVGDEGYLPLCRRCYMNRDTKNVKKLMLYKEREHC